MIEIPHSPIQWGAFALESDPDRLMFRGSPVEIEAEQIVLLRALLLADGVVPEVKLRHLLNQSSTALLRQVTALNVKLGQAAEAAGYIAHFPGRGFCVVRAKPEVRRDAASVPRRIVFGCDDAIASLAVRVSEYRLVTIVGPGGMGKTTLAQEFARRYPRLQSDGTHVVDLAPVRHPAHVPQAVAAVVDPRPWAGDPYARLRTALAGKRSLVILDNCEHLVGAVTRLVEDLLTVSDRIRVLATSREPLFLPVESIFRIRPLSLPRDAGRLSVDEALKHAGIQLFVERARAASPGFHPTRSDMPAIAQICRRLDGMPLAIELAAARIEQLGLSELTRQVVSRPLTALGPETSTTDRHGSVLDMLDWSYALLEPAQQRALQRLSVFRGCFTYDAAVCVVTDETLDEAAADACILALGEKSLLAGAAALGSRQLRLLDTTRDYADRLLEASDRHKVHARHARFLLNVLQRAEADWDTMRHEDWRETYSVWIDDVRAAIDWGFTGHGDPALGVDLTIAVIAIAAHGGLMSEFDERARVALRHLERFDPRQPLLEAQLKTLPVIAQPSPLAVDDRRYADLLWALAAGRNVGTLRQQLIAPLALWSSAFFSARYDDALRWIEEADRLVREHPDPPAELVVKRALALSLGSAGAHAKAREVGRLVLDSGDAKGPLSITSSSVSPTVSMRTMLARALWFQGFPDQAWNEANEATRIAIHDNPNSLCCALAVGAMPIALWRGDAQAFASLLPTFRDAILDHHAPYWTLWKQMYEQALSAVRQRAEMDASDLRLDGLHNVVVRYHMWTFGLGSVDPDAQRLAATGGCGWCGPELLRAAGERLRNEELLRRSLDLALQQDALGWALRAASSLATLLCERSRPAEALATLEPVYERCTEGSGTADMLNASALLSRFHSRSESFKLASQP